MSTIVSTFVGLLVCLSASSQTDDVNRCWLLSSSGHEVWHTKDNVQKAGVSFRQLRMLPERCGCVGAQLTG